MKEIPITQSIRQRQKGSMHATEVAYRLARQEIKSESVATYKLLDILGAKE